MLDSVVERKQLADFISTVRNHRHYHSQKVRLQRCGVARATYLVEGALHSWSHAAERQRMQAELTCIQLADGLLVHLSANTQQTIDYLRLATARRESAKTHSYVAG